MTERREPVRWRARATQTLGTSVACTVAAGGFLAVQAATGNDPALQQIAAREHAARVATQTAARDWAQANARAQAAAATPRRIVVIRKVIVTRRVVAGAGGGGAAPVVRTAAPVAVAPAAPAAPVAAAPAPAPVPVAPPPPVVSQGS
ncbi:hypothetical protein GKE82_07165 [Conexibacter sp. W3-3-2]|uniref:hypothetical protein n=1 Tax=Conexibacter sp. W3-3-2 TaxID=2675227 RepID=UPI0012B8B296|nr:hypothetical protein [Conexibacter sp. W3-3-2]MTD44088.1 hypothetical protein [Conexibacter sp. W3-3-2]